MCFKGSQLHALGNKSNTALVAALIQGSGLNADLQALEGTVLHVQGQQLRLRCFLLGDYMLQYKALGADGPGSALDDRQPCPYCSYPVH